MNASTRTILAAAMLVLLGCDPTAPAGWRSGEIRFDLRARASTAQTTGIPGTVLRRVSVLVLPPTGDTLRFEHDLTRGDVQPQLPVRAPTGHSGFVALVYSDNGTVLLADSVGSDVQDDHFIVNLAPRARTPILVLLPDSIDVNALVRVYNLGTGLLVWQVDTLSYLRSCPACISVSRPLGRLLPGTYDSLVVSRGKGSTTGTFDLPFISAQGTAVVRVRKL